MADPGWEKLQKLFDEAVALPPEERPAFLDEACGDDAELRREIDALLTADAARTGLKSDAGLLDRAREGTASLAGTTIDAWHLLERVGTGGMGSVYRAERADGSFQQQVALKVVKRGMDTENVIRRFEQERQILASLDHPNIARLLDGGVTDDGRPYFVMEYVDGLPITKYCDEHRLDVSARLTLFRQACHAVHTAHRNLIVHRDLKPSNIIVTTDGELKLLDFGIAKMLDSPEEQELTRTGLQVFTPAYAAPEQLLDDPVTTATDVYALGVILYELLSGRRPFEVRRTPSEFRDLVLTGEPLKPSAAVTEVLATADGDGSPTTIEQVSAVRGVRVERLQRSLRGDLDTICLMALHRQPDRRYSSADQIAADIDRHLAGQPVVARPDSIGYRMGKFLRRHRSGVAAAAVFVVAFIAMSSYYTLQLARERDFALEEQHKANEVVDFVTGLFVVSDPSESRGEEVTARELLDEGAARIQYELLDSPTVQLTMQRVLGEVYYSLGAHEKAGELLEDAYQRQSELLGENSLDTARTKLVLGLIHQDRGELEEADALYREVLAVREANLPRDHVDVREAIAARAFLEETLGEFEEAEALYRENLQLARQVHGDEHAEIAKAMKQLGGLLRIMDRPAEAEPMLRDALAMQQRVYDGPHPDSDDTKRQIAGLLRDSERFDEAKVLYEEVIESRTRMLGPDHMEVANSWNSYSQLLTLMGDHEGGMQANQMLIDTMQRAYKGPHPSLAAAYNNRAFMMIDLENYDGALENFRLAIDMQDKVGTPPRHLNRTFPLGGLASTYMLQERFDLAEEIFRDTIEIRREVLGEDHRLVTEIKSNLGEALTGLGRYDEAEALLLDAYQRFLDAFGPEYRWTSRSAGRLADLYELTGDEQKAAEYRALTRDDLKF